MGDDMKTFEDLYYEVLVRMLKEKNTNFLDKMELYDTHQLDCLLHPENPRPTPATAGPSRPLPMYLKQLQ
jgi:hypothetical protein